jgi:hypothetical protein
VKPHNARGYDGEFEMLTIFHGPSPNGEMFAIDRFMVGGDGKIVRRFLFRVCGGSTIPCHWSNG